MISIPHAGEQMPEEFRRWLTEDSWAWGRDVDYAVHQLIDIPRLLEQGIVVLKAHIHRVACDLNRAPEVAILNWRKNSQGVELVRAMPSEEEVQHLIECYHAPYFDAIAKVLDECPQDGSFSFIDLHSMPSRPTAYHLEKNPEQDGQRPDFCLSDLEGKSCAPAYIENMQKHLQAHGHQVLINNPYVGGYITQFAHPLVANNMQIEINRSLYMDEGKRKLTAKAQGLREQLTQALIEQFC